MSLSKMAATTLIDLVENKLAMLQIDGREDLREAMTLQRCLGELQNAMTGGSVEDKEDSLPRRGRHRKLSTLMEEMGAGLTADKKTA